MGLDMTLYRWDTAKYPNAKDPIPMDYDTDDWDGDYKHLEDVAYWRKFNALHNWFVNFVQGGVDECQYSLVTKKAMEHLLGLLEVTLNSKNSKNLPPASGFFFGSTEVDEYYWNDVECALETVKNLMTKINWETDKIYYHSSW